VTLRELIDVYVAARRAIGQRFVTDARILRSFLRAVGDVALETIASGDCHAFYDRGEPRTRTCEKRFGVLRGLFRFARARRLLSCSPLPARSPRVASTFRPHIYSIDQLRRLLDATSSLADVRSPLQPETFRTLLLLLYGAGLRAGEVLRLTLADVDLKDGSLRIRESKFSKSRLLPIGDALRGALLRYRAKRCALRLPMGPASAFFATRTGSPLSLGRLELVFRRMRLAAGLFLPHAPRRAQPRLHDLRHTFAVHRVLDWYRQGADVQQRLPWLSTYLGHRDLRATQVYLSLTPALLQAASARFALYAHVDELA